MVKAFAIATQVFHFWLKVNCKQVSVTGTVTPAILLNIRILRVNNSLLSLLFLAAFKI